MIDEIKTKKNQLTKSGTSFLGISISIGHVISPKTQKVDRKRVRVQFNWNVSKSDDDDDDDKNDEKNARTTITMSNG